MKIRHLIITLSFCFTSISVSAQELTLPNEFQIGFGLQEAPFTALNKPINLSIKSKYDKNVLRLGISYFYQHSQRQPKTDYLWNVGYERRFSDKDFQLFIGADICGFHRITDVYSTQYNFLSTANFKNIGIGPFLGFELIFSKRFSFQSEIGMFMGLYRDGDYYNGYNNLQVFDPNEILYQYHRKVSIHLYYNFGK